jgi:hypothetical protein
MFIREMIVLHPMLLKILLTKLDLLTLFAIGYVDLHGAGATNKHNAI